MFVDAGKVFLLLLLLLMWLEYCGLCFDLLVQMVLWKLDCVDLMVLIVSDVRFGGFELHIICVVEGLSEHVGKPCTTKLIWTMCVAL